MSKGFYTDGKVTIKLEDGEPIPVGFHKGRTFNSNPWNKGLTKETSDKVKKNIESMRETRMRDGSFISWNAGLTKETNESLQRVADKVSVANCGKTAWNKGIPATDEQKRKQSEAMKGRPSWNAGLTKDTNASVKSTSEKLIGHKCFVTDWEEAKRKESETKHRNGTFTTSVPEDEFYNYLCSLYGIEGVVRQYFDKDRYPFKCDFYVPSEDLFIEFNGNWTHGEHPFDPTNAEDVSRLNFLMQASLTDRGYYKGVVYTWTDLDVRKLETFRKNNLNFMIIYPSSNIIITK